MEKLIEKVIFQNLKSIKENQKKNGSFKSLSSFDEKFKKNIFEKDSLFISCFILDCLAEFRKNKFAEKSLRKGISFLKTQKSPFWSFNYWIRGSKDSNEFPYPDDLDDTACALAVMMKHSEQNITGDVLAYFVQVLTSVEQKEGGPYKTWLVRDDKQKKWSDIDIAVNCNVAYFLSMHGISLGSIEKLVGERIRKKDFSSPYYATEFSVIYFISRFYKKEDSKIIIEYLLSKKKKDGSWGNQLDSAFAIISLRNLGYKGDLSDSLKFILRNRKKWIPCPFVMERMVGDKKIFSSSKELTAVFCLCALQKGKVIQESIPKKIDFNDKKSAVLDRVIMKKVGERFASLGEENRQLGLKIIEKITKNDHTKQITLLPFYFEKALRKKTKNGKHLVQLLGEANLFGWIAYAIYDDFFDDEGDIKLLSLANICLREAVGIFHRREITHEFKEILQSVMDEIDLANYWEITNCRMERKKGGFIMPKELPAYGNFSKLAQRSMGHALGPIALLISCGFKKDSKEVLNALKFFSHYIIARQLDDDAHDWEDDLKKGHLTSITVSLVKQYKKKHGRNSYQLNLRKCEKDLQGIFWNDLIAEKCENILYHINLAERYAKKLSHIVEIDFFEMLTLPIKNSAKNTIIQQKEMKEFLSAYKS